MVKNVFARLEFQRYLGRYLLNCYGKIAIFCNHRTCVLIYQLLKKFGNSSIEREKNHELWGLVQKLGSSPSFQWIPGPGFA
jgi:hypothetical protein